MTHSPERYSAVAIALHWIIAILMIFMLFPGEDLIKVDEDQSLAGFGPSLHASIGITILILSVARLGWRLIDPPPPLPAHMKPLEATAAHGAHLAFYVLMIGLPLTGWMALAPYAAERFDGDQVSFFGLFAANVMPNLGETPGDLHEVAGKAAIALIALHVLAALKHQLWDRDGLLSRMLWR